MRTTDAKPAKGAEPQRTVADDLRVLLHIARMAIDYLWTGRRIRKEFFARQRAGEKYYVDGA